MGKNMVFTSIEHIEKELKFALENGVNITKHDVVFPKDEQIKELAQRLKLKCSLEARFHDGHAYYVLNFSEKDSATSFATYFGLVLVDEKDNFTFEPKSEIDENVEELLNL